MKMKIPTLIAMALLSGSTAFSNTTLINNTTFDGYPAFSAFEGWVMPANRFQNNAGTLAYIETVDVRNDAAFTFDSRVAPSGDGWTFTNWDDGVADHIETFMLHQFNAGPPGDFENTLFETGDTIVFKGKIRHEKSRPSVVTRAFIKFLGFNDQGWAFQVKENETVYFNTTTELQDFELRTQFPDLSADDSFQVVQLGFESTAGFADGAFGEGTIYFQDIEGYIEGTGPELWNGYEVDANGWANTGDWMGFVNVMEEPWIYVASLSAYVYLPSGAASASGAWIYKAAP